MLNSIIPGLMTMRLPTNPMITAVHLLIPTVSDKNIGDRAVTINGAIKARVKALAKEITEIE